MDIDDLVIGLCYVGIFVIIVSAFCLVVAEYTLLLPYSKLFQGLICSGISLSVGVLAIRYISLVVLERLRKLP